MVSWQCTVRCTKYKRAAAHRGTGDPYTVPLFLQAEEYVERVVKPRQQERKKKREMYFNRLFGHATGEGHILGVRP